MIGIIKDINEKIKNCAKKRWLVEKMMKKYVVVEDFSENLQNLLNTKEKLGNKMKVFVSEMD